MFATAVSTRPSAFPAASRPIVHMALKVTAAIASRFGPAGNPCSVSTICLAASPELLF